MVYVVNGVAHEGHKPRGVEYKREPTKFSHQGPLDLESTDLHLYVCAACPWAHRTLLTRNLSKTLRDKITVSVVSPYRDDAVGWEFLSEQNKETLKKFTALPVTIDQSPIKAPTLLDVYLKAKPDYTGNITTPTLYDAKTGTILSNDSFGIMRHFVETVPGELGYLYATPEAIDREGRTIDAELCNRVYMCGLAKTQTAYEESLRRVFAELDRIEDILSDGRLFSQQSAHYSKNQVLLCQATSFLESSPNSPKSIWLAYCEQMFFGSAKCGLPDKRSSQTCLWGKQKKDSRMVRETHQPFTYYISAHYMFQKFTLSLPGSGSK